MKIKTFDGACKALGIDPKSLPVVNYLPEKHQQSLIAYYKLVIIAQALNEGWEPNWNDTGEYKYYPWFQVKASEKKPGGSGFVGVGYYAGWYSNSDVGSRLCFKSRELALYAGETFKKLYQQYLLIE